MAEREYARRTARVLVVDGAGRVLLFECRLPEPPCGTGWFTPGGGVANGESLAEAVVRELGEETGLVVSPDQLGPWVAGTEGYAELGWVNGWLRDDFFLCRVDAHEVDTSGWGPHDRASVIGYRWWTASELSTTDQTVYPISLGTARRRAGRGPTAGRAGPAALARLSADEPPTCASCSGSPEHPSDAGERQFVPLRLGGPPRRPVRPTSPSSC